MKFTRKYYLRTVVSILIGIIRIAASLFFVWISKTLVDIATGNIDKSLETYAVMMIVTMLIQILGNLAASWWENLNVVKTGNEMKYGLFSHVLSSTWKGKEVHHSGDIMNRLGEDVRVVVDLICVRVPDIVVTICQLVAASIYLFSLAPNLLWMLLCLMVIAVVGSRMFFKTIRRLTKSIREGESAMQQHMQENIRNRVLVLTMVGVERVLSKLGFIQKDIQDNTVHRLNYNAVARAFMGCGFMFGYAAAFLWGVFGIKGGTVTFGTMTAFLQLVGQVQRPIADLSRHIPAIIHATTSFDRLKELELMPLEEQGDPIFFNDPPEIVVSEVSFAYDEIDNEIFEKFSCTFPAGRITEVTGPTGIGKSTLIRLIVALLKPSEGKITVGGVPTCAATRCNFTYVPQGNSLMSGTIRENLLLSNAEASDEEIATALKTAAAEFVFNLPKGLDTVCGEDGSGLSEGQAQRIAVARALLGKGSVIILDEATSALDSETERQLLSNLQDTCKGRKTVIFISHRPAVAGICDCSVAL